MTDEARSAAVRRSLLDSERAASGVSKTHRPKQPEDCGGAELILLDPVLYPSLSMATMLVETHDAFDARITHRLISRFSSTHQIDFVSVTGRQPGKHRLLGGLRLTSAQMALEENRQVSKLGKPQTWALLTPYTS